MNADESKPEVEAAESKPDAGASPPSAKPTEPTANAGAVRQQPDPKALALTHDAKAPESKPGGKAEPKTEAMPEPLREAKAGSKPKAIAETKPAIKADESKPATQTAAPKRKLGNTVIFTIATLGILAGLVAAYVFGMARKSQPPVFQPISNPYGSAIYANGMIESDLPSGENINIFPQVSGPIIKVLVKEGQSVKAGALLFTIEDSVQRANTKLAEATLKLDRDQYDKDRASYDLEPKSISRNVVDVAEDTVTQAAASLKAANALLQYYSVKAPVDGVVLAVNAAVGGYVSPQGNFDTYTELFDPLVVMSGPQEYMDVRCYVDEILVSKLPTLWHIEAEMQPMGTDIKVPLEFVRVQPYISPKIELSNQKQEQVDLRVLPVIFRFEKKDLPVYPGQMVDVFIGQK